MRLEQYAPISSAAVCAEFQGRSLPRNARVAWLMLVAVVSIAVSFQACAPRMSHSTFNECLRRVVASREMVSEDCLPGKLITVDHESEDRDSVVTIAAIRVGNLIVTLDGEALPPTVDLLREGGGDAMRSYPGFDMDSLREWESFGYLVVSPDARRVYRSALVGEECVTDRMAYKEVVTVEYNRLVRRMRDIWISWDRIEVQADLVYQLAEVADERELAKDIAVTLSAIRKTAIAVNQLAAPQSKASRVDAIVLSLCGATDMRLGRSRLTRSVGFYDGLTGFYSMRRSDLAAVVEFWDDERLTRYVTKQNGYWEVLTVGQWIQMFADLCVGERVDRQRFLEWVRSAR